MCNFFNIRKIVLLSLIGLLGFTPVALAEITAEQYGVILNLSGRQRMLTQKMSKEILLVSLGIDKAGNLANLEKTSKLFDRTLKGLMDGDAELKLPGTEKKRIRKQLGKVQDLWTPFFGIVQTIISQKSVTPEQLTTITQTNLPLLNQMNKCVKLYEREANKAGLKSVPGLAVAINLSGKQRMLSQKMSKEFLLVASGQDIENNRLNLLETSSLFERTLKGLLDGDDTLDLTPTKQDHIRKQLNEVVKLWEGMRPLVVKATDPKTQSIPQGDVEQLAKQNLPLLAEMNKAVKMYEVVAAN